VIAGGLLLLALLSLPAAAAPLAAGRLSFEDHLANLKSPNAKTRQESAAALGKSRRREAIAPLAALVHDPEAKVRMEVVRALNGLRDASAVPALLTSLTDGDPKIREEALGGLVELYSERERTTPVTRFLDAFSDEYDRASVPPYTSVDPQVFGALAEALHDAEADIREQAAYAIGILNGRGVVKELVGALQDPDAEVRGAAATALGKVGSADDGRALVPLTADESASVRNRALKAIGVLRVKSAGPALRELFDANRRRETGVRALESLSRIGDASQAELFRELVQDPDTERRRLAVEGLGRIGDGSLLPALKKDYQREKNDEMRIAYAFAISLLGDRAFLDTIVLGLPSRLHGNRCRRYLLEIGRDMLADLYPYLSDPDEDIRAELCDIVAALGDSLAVPMLQPLIGDPSRKVADRANRAVERLRRGGGPGAERQ
jgi:HEAT repeat protein